jgi:hypothetical protein
MIGPAGRIVEIAEPATARLDDPRSLPDAIERVADPLAGRVGHRCQPAGVVECRGGSTCRVAHDKAIAGRVVGICDTCAIRVSSTIYRKLTRDNLACGPQRILIRPYVTRRLSSMNGPLPGVPTIPIASAWYIEPLFLGARK